MCLDIDYYDGYGMGDFDSDDYENEEFESNDFDSDDFDSDNYKRCSEGSESSMDLSESEEDDDFEELSQDPRESEVETSCSEDLQGNDHWERQDGRSDDEVLDYSEPDSKGDEWDNFISELTMMGEEDIPDCDDVEENDSDEDEYSFDDIIPDPRPSDVEEDITLWDEEDFWRSPDWKCTLSDDEKEGELSSWEFDL